MKQSIKKHLSSKLKVATRDICFSQPLHIDTNQIEVEMDRENYNEKYEIRRSVSHQSTII